MSHEIFEDAVAQYAVGALDREERERLEAHLTAGCASCQTALEEYRKVAGLLPYGLAPAAVPPELRARVLAAAWPSRHRAALGRSPVSPWTSWALTPAFVFSLLVLLIGTGTYALFLRSQITTEGEHQAHIETALQNEAGRIATLQQQIAEQERQLATLQAEFAQREEMLTFLKSPRVRVVSLAGLERAKEAGALLLYDPDSKNAFFYAFNMPPLPVGKTYQLWAIVGTPVSAGTFSTDAGHKSRIVIRNLPDASRITQFAVSLEPAGGRPQPTGDIYLSGQL